VSRGDRANRARSCSSSCNYGTRLADNGVLGLWHDYRNVLLRKAWNGRVRKGLHLVLLLFINLVTFCYVIMSSGT